MELKCIVVIPARDEEQHDRELFAGTGLPDDRPPEL